MNEALLRSLVAGWICGGAVGLAAATGLVILAAKRPAVGARIAVPRIGFAATWIFLANALVIGLTLVGLILGAVHDALGDPRFSIAVVALAGGVAALYRFVRGRPGPLEARVAIGSAVVALAVFGGALPLLASWS